jgi:mRNA-degrading endonuclease HigB of HigAB toxin-antitoxin module
MQIITVKPLRDFGGRYVQVRALLLAWEVTVSEARWEKSDDVVKTFNTADFVFGEFWVFNVGSCRVVAIVKYQRATPKGNLQKGRVYIRHVFSHADYDVWWKGLMGSRK